MRPQPNLETDRLILRPFNLQDAAKVQRLAGDYAVAQATLNIPHPYADGMAESWISGQAEAFALGEQAVYAIIVKSEGQLIGCVGLTMKRPHARAELGYWIGRPYWNQGYCTEAARALIRYGFEQLKLNRIYAHHFTRNPASGRVLQKLGMTHEGHLRQHFRKWDVYEDVELFGILKSEPDHSKGE